jgi:hypothetical protein
MLERKRTGRMMKKILMITVTVGMLIACGCEVDVDSLSDAEDRGSGGGGGSGGDAISPGSISWLGANYSSAAITAKINSASMDSEFIYTSYDSYNWPSKSMGGARVNAICCLFYERGGQIVGGKFDFWRAGGQSAKTLENVRHRYQGHSFPARGTRVYTMIVSLDGSQRSNISTVSWQ